MGVDFLNGWDAMVATTQANVNQGLQLAYNDGLLPKELNASFSIKVFGIDIAASVDAQLGAWKMSGGSGKNAVIGIPFTGGNLTIGNTSYALAGAVFQVTVLLSLIKSPVVPASGTDYTVRIDFTSPDAIVAVQVLNPPPGLDQSSIDIVALNFLKDALGGHTYDIVTVNLGSVQADYPYLVPTLFDYAIDTNSTDPNSTVMGIQMLSVSKTPGNQDIIPGTIPGGTPACDSVALVSNQLLVSKLILPGLASALGVADSQLTTTYVGGNWVVSNLSNITLSSSHNPVVTSLTAAVDDNLLTLNIIGNCVPTPGITIDFTINANYALQLVTSATGQTINLVEQGSPNVNHSVSVATWVIITASALALLVTAVMGPLFGLVVAAIEALIIYLVATIANNKAGDILPGSLPSVVPSNLNWSYLNVFTIKQALMPTPLQLGGTMPILEPT